MSLASTFSALEPPFSAQLGAPSGPGWVGADEGCRDEALLESMLDGVADLYLTDRRDIMAARVLEVWAFNVASPAAAALLTARRLPDVRAANVVMDPVTGSVALRRPTFLCLPGDPAAGHPDARVVPDDAALVAELRRALADEHLAPLVETLNRMTRRPARALWRGAADRVVGAFEWAGQQLDCLDDAYGLATACLRGAPGPLSARVELVEAADGTVGHVRDGCCLYWRVPACTDGEPCPTCPLARKRAAARS
ncbi:MAG TPA: IucA/IucC family C-terminal-domain containing protein [Capillimicrobium sp.]|jgi:hypothetical protein